MLYIPYPFRQCRACGQLFPETEAYFRVSRRTNQTPYMLSKCRACEKIYTSERNKINAQKPEVIAYRKAYDQKPEVKARRRAYERKPEVKAMRKAYQHTPQSLDYHYDYYRKPEVKARYRARWHDPEYAKREKARRQTSEWRIIRRKYLSSYHHSPVGSAKRKANIHRRLARKNNLPDTFTTHDWQQALDYFGNCCAVCGRPQGLWHRIAADHWIPLTSPDCPGTIPTNIIPLCHSRKDGIDSCNNTKTNRNAYDWLVERYGTRKAKQINMKILAYFAWVANQSSGAGE